MAAQVIECGSECTVTVQLAPASPSEENIADITVAFGLIFLFVGTVWCVKQLLNLVVKDES